ncbi:Hypothetical predicted protein [Octopus vulgaris]|uniref:Uncharacterized protein n=1 Tax=Octopus vulgaris TaxID=6645 RepID=A0AA36B0I1_OCTVU|nr:Hypothetical predicted protein [Octopus vulgaris]
MHRYLQLPTRYKSRHNLFGPRVCYQNTRHSKVTVAVAIDQCIAGATAFIVAAGIAAVVAVFAGRDSSAAVVAVFAATVAAVDTTVRRTVGDAVVIVAPLVQP